MLKIDEEYAKAYLRWRNNYFQLHCRGAIYDGDKQQQPTVADTVTDSATISSVPEGDIIYQ